MAFGVNWVFQKDRMGDYQAGYITTGLDQFPIARAAAASACFPPVFEPMDPRVDATQYQQGKAVGDDADRCRRAIRLTDGGVYDNMGLEPVWKTFATVLVSDAGGEFEYAADRGTISDIKRYPDVMGNQARALRKRWLLANFTSGPAADGTRPLAGTYWATSSDRARYQAGDTLGYSADLAEHVIAKIRTDLDEDFRQERWPCWKITATCLQISPSEPMCRGLYDAQILLTIPYPTFMDEVQAREALKR